MPVFQVAQLFGDEHIHLPLRAFVEHRRVGSVRLVNQVIPPSRTPPAIRSPSPELGEYTSDMLRDLGYSGEATVGLGRWRVV